MGLTFEIPKSLEVGLISIDNKDMMPISSSLKKVGLQNITIFETLEAAFTFAKTKKNALLIFDVRSQIGAGIEHIKDIKVDNECSNFPIIPVVKSGDQATVQQLLKDYGVSEVVTIPLQTANLLHSIRRTLAGFLPGELENQIQIVRFALEKGEIDSASEVLEKLSGKRKSIRTELGLSYVSLVRNDHDGSRHYLKSARNFDPTGFAVQLATLKTLLHESAGQNQIEECVQELINHLAPVSRVGQILKAFYRAGKFVEGFGTSIMYEKEFLVDPNLRLWQAKLALKCNRIDSALQFLGKFHGSGQKTLESLNMLGVLHKKKKNLDLALKAFEEANRISPRDFRILFNLGLVHEDLGDGPKAAEYYAMTIELEPSFEKAKLHLSRLKPRLLAG